MSFSFTEVVLLYYTCLEVN